MEFGEKGAKRGLIVDFGLVHVVRRDFWKEPAGTSIGEFRLCCYLSIASWGFGLSACMICFVTSDAGSSEADTLPPPPLVPPPLPRIAGSVVH